jgi:23S rRNA (cytosine1962-C5)-methyltransferase
VTSHLDSDGALREPTTAPWRAERILLDQDGLLVVDKLAGIPVHGGNERLRESVVERLADFRGERGTYLGVHSRLDVGTSGALLFTTEERRNADVAQALEEGTLKRSYLGVVSVASSARLAQKGTVRVSLEFDGSRARVSSAGKAAVTHYQVLDSADERRLVRFELETGRTHQIRASMEHLGAPLLGDALYGGAKAPRLCLHAAELRGGPLPSPIVAKTPACFDEVLRYGDYQGRAIADVGELVRDALLLRAPEFGFREGVRIIDGFVDLFPGITVDVYGHVFVMRADRDVPAALEQAVGREMRELGFEPLLSIPAHEKVARPKLLLREFGENYRVDLERVAQGGFPLELSELRRHLLDFPRPNRVLDLFCGGGALSRAVSRGNTPTVHIDLSRGALEQAKSNLDLSTPSFGSTSTFGAQHEFWQVDVRNYLSRAQKKLERFDFVIVDPPAKTTRKRPVFSVPSDYEATLESALGVLADTATVVFVARHVDWTRKNTRERFATLVRRRGFVLQSSATVKVGPDFRSHTSTVAWILRLCRI